MRINFLVPDLKISGGGKIICEYARRLAQRGHQITITARQKHWSLLRNIFHPLVNTVRWIDLKGVRVRFIPRFHAKYIPNSDIIFATAWKTAELVNELPPSKGAKFYLVQHHMGSPSPTAPINRTYLYPMVKIAVSRWIQEQLTTQFNQPAEYIPVAIDPTEFFPEEKTSAGTPQLGMLYHTALEKGFHDGLKAVKLVQKLFPNIKLLLFGARHRRPDLDNSSIKFTYHHALTGDKLRRFYCACDIFISPSWYEGFGLPGLEAMACQVALVTTDNGGCRDYAINNETALVSPIKDPPRLAENIIRLLTSPILKNRLSQNGYQMAQKFNWEHSLSMMEKILMSYK